MLKSAPEYLSASIDEESQTPALPTFAGVGLLNAPTLFFCPQPFKRQSNGLGGAAVTLSHQICKRQWGSLRKLHGKRHKISRNSFFVVKVAQAFVFILSNQTTSGREMLDGRIGLIRLPRCLGSLPAPAEWECCRHNRKENSAGK